jgi:hypothetical protein
MNLIKLLKESILAEAKKKKPSSGLTKKEKSAVAKKARAGKDIGKKGKGFEKVAKKAAKEYGSEKIGKKVAAASMWKNIKRKGAKLKEGHDGIDDEGNMAKSQLSAIIKYAQAIHDNLEDDTQLDAWVQSHISKAEQLLDQVGHFLAGEEEDKQKEPQYMHNQPIIGNVFERGIR